jgi:hypothetical protein
MAPHVCALLFKPRREEWAEVLNLALSSRWCALSRTRARRTLPTKKQTQGWRSSSAFGARAAPRSGRTRRSCRVAAAYDAARGATRAHRACAPRTGGAHAARSIAEKACVLTRPSPAPLWRHRRAAARARGVAAAGVTLVYLLTPGTKIKARDSAGAARLRSRLLHALPAKKTRVTSFLLLAHARFAVLPRASQGVGFDDFVKSKAVKAGAGGKRAANGKVVATSFDAFLNNVAVTGGAAPRGPVTGFDHFLKKHVTKARANACVCACVCGHPSSVRVLGCSFRRCARTPVLWSALMLRRALC